MARRAWIETTRRSAVAIGLAAAATVAPAAAQPQPVPAPAARKPAAPDPEAERRAEQALALHDEARDLYERGDYRAAIDRLEKALALDPNGKELVYNLALIHEKLGELDASRRYYEAYLQMETDPALLERTQKALKRLEGARARLGSREPPPQSSPGDPAAEASAAPPGASSPDDTSARRPIDPWVWITGGIAASAFVVGNFFAISALVVSPGADARTGGGVGIEDLQADAESAHRRAVVADVSFAVALVAAGAAVYLYLTTPPRRAARERHLPAAAWSF